VGEVEHRRGGIGGLQAVPVDILVEGGTITAVQGEITAEGRQEAPAAQPELGQKHQPDERLHQDMAQKKPAPPHRLPAGRQGGQAQLQYIRYQGWLSIRVDSLSHECRRMMGGNKSKLLSKKQEL